VIYVALAAFLAASVVTFALDAVQGFKPVHPADETVWGMGKRINGKPFRGQPLRTRPIGKPARSGGGGGPRHPGGRTCVMSLPSAALKTARAMWVHRRELLAEVRSDGAHAGV
jgi:hypothetical protein